VNCDLRCHLRVGGNKVSGPGSGSEMYLARLSFDTLVLNTLLPILIAE
jgi:hypothetical protein